MEKSDRNKKQRQEETWRQQLGIVIDPATAYGAYEMLSDESIRLIEEQQDTIFNIFREGSLDGQLYIKSHA
jgi:hypothetical protein